ncbi:MAG: hypothetical protein KIT15_02360 [Xanthobacteraceae bacterium]|nr:hypothetical protein [Xanthobacteraceae bacterium]
MMWWPPYRKRVLAEADELMECYGDQVRNAASRLCREAHNKANYGQAHFYRRVARYLEQFTNVTQTAPTGKQEPYLAEVLERFGENKTIH